MDLIERARAKAHYRNYTIALQAYLKHSGNYEEWSAAYAKWIKTIRELQIGRFDREAIHEEVIDELQDVL